MERVQAELDMGKEIVFETGALAGQATGSAKVSMGDSIVLVTTVVREDRREGVNFLPLLCDFEEKMYAAGKIPGGFIKREGRPSEYAILIARLMDRSHRPLFPEGFYYDTQVVATPLSFSEDVPLDILSVNGASASLMLSGAPLHAPIGCVRIAWDGSEYTINPSFDELSESKMDLVVTGTQDHIVMVECKAAEVAEDIILQAMEQAHQKIKCIAQAICELAEKAGKPRIDLPLFAVDPQEIEKIKQEAGADLKAIFLQELPKAERDKGISTIKTSLIDKWSVAEDAQQAFSEAFFKATKSVYRDLVLQEKKRANSREATQIRKISCEAGLLPRAHGSGLFTRGETQALTIATLGALGEMQVIDGLTILESKRFMHQYNFPPYSVGEVKPMRGPGRREIGHGALAEKALSKVIPSEEDFPYTIRLVSEILSSNGSTSMASVCGSTLALMDAGVPIKSPVSGIAMGLIQGDQESVILSDIQGIEDAFGDMDFKVAGTKEGVTALQMDIKVKGVSAELLEKALGQAKAGRLEILEKMIALLPSPRGQLSEYAPHVSFLEIPTDAIGKVIGPGGKTIRKITEETGAKIDINDEGKVFITAPDQESGKKAMQWIADMTREIKVGEIFEGRVVKTLSFGAIVELAPGKDGMIHISQLSFERVPSVEDVLKVGDAVTVKVIGIDNGKVQLSRKALLNKDKAKK